MKRKKCSGCGGSLNSVGMCFPCDGTTIPLDEGNPGSSSESDQENSGNQDNSTTEQVQAPLRPENICPICQGYKNRFQGCCSTCYDEG